MGSQRAGRGAVRGHTQPGSEVLPDAEFAPRGLATIHPSAILRADEAEREAELQALVDDLRAAAKLLSN